MLSRGEIVFPLYCFLIVFGLDKPGQPVLQCPQISQIKAMRKQSTPEVGPLRERATVKIPRDKPEEEPFQVQTERRKASRGGAAAARYHRQGLMEPGKRSKSGGTTERRPSS